VKRQKRSTNARGYGCVHQKTRQRYAELVASALAVCARCGLAFDPRELWDLTYRRSRGLAGSSASPLQSGHI